MTFHPSWTEEELIILRREWPKGTVSREIGYLINKSKNAVIGQAHRLKLGNRVPGNTSPRRPKADKTEGQPRPKRAPRDNMPRKPTPPKFYPEAVPLTTDAPISIGELNTCTCRAIVGHGPDGLAVYCGDMVFQNKPFCEGHCAMYYQLPDQRHRAR